MHAVIIQIWDLFPFIDIQPKNAFGHLHKRKVQCCVTSLFELLEQLRGSAGGCAVSKVKEFLHAVLIGFSIVFNLLCDTFDAVIVVVLGWGAFLGVLALCIGWLAPPLSSGGWCRKLSPSVNLGWMSSGSSSSASSSSASSASSSSSFTSASGAAFSDASLGASACSSVGVMEL